MNRDLENLLSSCLDQLEQGTDVDAILSRYPAESEEIRPYLETAAQISQLSSQPTLAAQQESRQNFLAQAAAMRESQTPTVPFWYTLRRFLLPASSLALILLLLGFSLVTVSANALPGDALYPVKRSVEELRLQISADPEQILDLSAQYRAERLREIEMLLLSGREADVSFEGPIEAINLTNWIVAGLTVEIDDNTVIEGRPQIAEIARINGYTSGGLLFAREIRLLSGRPDPEPTPLPTLVPAQEPSATATAAFEEPANRVLATATATASPTPTNSPTPTATEAALAPIVLTPTATATPTPTSTAVLEPTAAPPVSDDNGDDGEQGNDNEGENENAGEDGDDNENEGGSDNDGDNDNHGDDNNNGDSGGDEGDNDNDNDDDSDNDNDAGDNDNDDDEESSDEDNDNGEEEDVNDNEQDS